MVLKEKPVVEGPALGLFSAPGYIGVGDKYQDRKESSLTRHKGRQFTTSSMKEGKTLDAFFEKEFHTLAGTKYIEQSKVDRAYEAQKKKGNITDKPFRPSSPPKIPVGLGGLYGTIGDYPEYKADPKSRGPSSKKDKSGSKPNFRTSPVKIGGFGVPNTGLSPDPPYMSSKYDAAREDDLARAKKARAKEHGPFRSMSKSVDLFNPKVYEIDPSLTRARERPKTAAPLAKPFMPTRASDEPIGKFPEHVTDPWIEPSKVDRIGRKPLKGPSFVPPSPARSRPIRSIALNYIDVRPRTAGVAAGAGAAGPASM